MSSGLTDKEKQKVKLLRNNFYGYIGGKEISEIASDEELLELCDLEDKIAECRNKILAIKASINRRK